MAKRGVGGSGVKFAAMQQTSYTLIYDLNTTKSTGESF